MTTYDTTAENSSVESRTRRACEEPMVVVPEGDGTGLFEVWTGTCDEDDGQPYVVDLGGAHDRCTCADMEYNLSEGELCKHSRRVRLEFGLPPFEDIPAIRSEHAAPMDVELARRRRGIDVHVVEEPEPEPEVEPITVEDAKPERAVRVATDGGQVVESTPEPEPEPKGESPETGLPEITEHVEPPEQGGARFVRCEGCGEEVIGTDESRLVHREGCAHAVGADYTLPAREARR
jgi:hypothetical protein